MARFLGSYCIGRLCLGYLRFASISLLLLCLLFLRPQAVRSHQDDLSPCIDTFETLLADEMWFEHLADPVLSTNPETGDRLRLYNQLSECVAPLKSEEALSDEVSTLLSLVEYYDIFIGAWLDEELVYAYDLATIEDPAILTLREEVHLPPPPGLVFVRPFASGETLPEPIADTFASETVRGVTILTRYVAILVPEEVQALEWEFWAEDYRETLSHELVHTYVNSSLGIVGMSKMPDWFHEGVAIYFSGSSKGHSMVTPDGIRIEHRPTTEYYNYGVDFEFLEAQLGQEALYSLLLSSIENQSEEELYRAVGVANYEELRQEANEWRSKSQFRRYVLLIGVIILVGVIGWWYFFRSPIEPVPVAQQVAVPGLTTRLGGPSWQGSAEDMLLALPGDQVAIHYQMRLDDERLIRSTYSGDPLRFVVGSDGNQFANLVLGMREGQFRNFTIPAHDMFDNMATGSVTLTVKLVSIVRPSFDATSGQPGGISFA